MVETAALQLTDEAFIVEFENLTLDPTHFSHYGHLRLAWLYLMNYDVETAIEKVCTGIKAYAESLGANTKFNLTMTDAITRIIADRMNRMRVKEWDLFLEQNEDLVEDVFSVLDIYFSRELLMSEEARLDLVVPDRKQLPICNRN